MRTAIWTYKAENRHYMFKTLLEHNSVDTEYVLFTGKSEAVLNEMLESDFDAYCIDINHDTEGEGIALAEKIKRRKSGADVAVLSDYESDDDFIHRKCAVKENAVMVKSGEKEVRILISEINYIELNNKRLTYVLDNKIEVVSNTIRISMEKALEQLLEDEMFIKCHNAFVVNMRKVVGITSKDFILRDELRVPISKKRHNEIKKVYLTYTNK